MNVLIYRLPREESVVSPPSACPGCGNNIKSYDNIPVLSYIFLRGKCRNCGEKISIQYPVVELTTAVAALFVYLNFGMTIEFAKAVTFAFLLLGAGFTDYFTAMDEENFECGIIPDTYSLGGLVVGLGFAFFTELGIKDSVFGAAAGFLSLWLPAFLYNLIKKKEGMGGGDIKLMAMIGAFLGWQSIYFVVFLSAIAGALVGIPATYLMKDKDYQMPYGPFIVIAAFGYLFYGDYMIGLLF